MLLKIESFLLVLQLLLCENLNLRILIAKSNFEFDSGSTIWIVQWGMLSMITFKSGLAPWVIPIFFGIT